MMYFFWYTSTGLSELWTPAALQQNRNSAASQRLLERIYLTAQTCKINCVAGEHRNRLQRSPESSSPNQLAGRKIESQGPSRLYTDNAFADHRRRCDQLAGRGFPAQMSGLSLERIKETVLAAENGDIPRHCRGRRDAKPGFVFPANFPCVGVHGVKEEIFRPDEHQASCNRRGRIDAVARGSTPNYFSGCSVEAIDSCISAAQIQVPLGCINGGVDSATEFLNPPRAPAGRIDCINFRIGTSEKYNSITTYR